MLRELKNNKNATEIPKNMSSVFSQGVIIYPRVQKRSSKFSYGVRSLKSELRPERSTDNHKDT